MTTPAEPPTIVIEDIAYVRRGAPDLDLMERFLGDFGLRRADRTADALYMRAAGPLPFAYAAHRGEPETLGIGLTAQHADDLDRLAARFGVAVTRSAEPGGGAVVTIRDPGGLRIDVVHGQRPAEPAPSRLPRTPNTAHRQERLGSPLRQDPGAASVMRLGHVVLLVPDFEAALAFYTGELGLRISDTYHGPDPTKPVFAFLHCGLGERWTDHHTIAIGTPPGGIERERFDHIAFEVLDLDDLMAGHAHLKAAGWRHSWGIGRHVEGSQIFDYWRDPWGQKVEHWTDGDRVNHGHVPGHGPMSPERLAQWGPPFNPEFFE